MADIHDWHVEQMFDPDFDEYDGNGRGEYNPFTKKCRYCGTKLLMWKKTNDGWRLFDIHGEIHSCTEA